MIELTIEEDGSVVSATITKNNVGPTTTYKSIDNLPEELKTKLSVLRLSDTYQDIDGIGQKVSDNLFWLYADEDTKNTILNTQNLTLMLAFAEAINNNTPIHKTLSVTEAHDERIRGILNGYKHTATWVDDNTVPRNFKGSKASGTRGKSDRLNRQIRLFADRQTNRRSRGRLR